MNGSHQLILASASPRRLLLLRQLGLSPLVSPAKVDEVALPGEMPSQLVSRLAEAKCRLTAEKHRSATPPCVVLAADTAVVIEGRMLGKPLDIAHAEGMLRLLRGKSHEVLTGVFLMRTDDGRHSGGVEITRVRFKAYDDAAIKAYVATGEPMDKAGAYGIQGRGSELAELVDGSWSNVVGLPLERLPRWIERLGIELQQIV